MGEEWRILCYAIRSIGGVDKVGPGGLKCGSGRARFGGLVGR